MPCFECCGHFGDVGGCVARWQEWVNDRSGVAPSTTVGQSLSTVGDRVMLGLSLHQSG